MKNTTHSVIARALRNEVRVIQIGRSRHVAGFGTNTPVDIVAGDAPPVLTGQPYLKTTFSNGRGFRKTLYTPSSLLVTVGAEWVANQTGVWSN